MHAVIREIENKFRKPQVVDVRSGDTVKVHVKIKEGEKERTQTFEGLVISVKGENGVNQNITVRKIVSGVGVEKIFPIHSSTIEKIEVIKEAKVRRAKLYYMRERSGKSARLKETYLKEGDIEYIEAPEMEAATLEATTEAELPAVDDTTSLEEAPLEASEATDQK